MRSFALAFVSSLLLSPISVLATYGEHDHHPDHPGHPDHPDHPDHLNHPDHLDHSHKSDEDDHAISKINDMSAVKVARIAIYVDFLLSDVTFLCKKEEDTCLEKNKCHEKDESCGRKNKCHKKKRECLKEYKCQKNAKTCHKKTTNRYGLRCGRKFYNQAKIIAAAKAACKKIGKNSQSGSFPAAFDAFEYRKAGPYVEWPITRTRSFFRRRSRSKRRLVMTMDCAVVGGVVRHKGGEYSQCKYERH